MVRLTVPISYLVGLVALAIFGQMTVAGVLAINLFSNLVALILVLILVIPLARKEQSSHSLVDIGALGRDVRYGISAHLGALQPFSGLRIDVLLLTLLLSVHDLGLYMAALAGAGLIKAQGMALGKVVLPEIAGRVDFQEQRKLLVWFSGLTIVLGCLTAMVPLLWAKPLIILVYGDAFIDAAPILRILVVAGIVGSFQRVLADALRGMGHPLHASAAELASLGVGIPAIFLLVPSGGTTGAAIAVALATVAAFVVTMPKLLSTLLASHTQQIGTGNGVAKAGLITRDTE
jgi:O-antigen/teichoic acid export membrane protein